jgi:pyrroloquinoline quinone (PQQ) biosynthesis protein C
MPGKATLKAHADLVDRMAGTVGLDLEEVMMEGRMTFDQLGEAVLACTGCTQPETCQHWLALQHTSDEAAPGYCRNRDTFQRLASGKHA